MSHIEGFINANGDSALEQLLDSCWKDGMVQSATTIYELSRSQLLVVKSIRANMNIVVEQIERIISL